MSYLDHRTQYDNGPLAAQNCTPTSGANGMREATNGRRDFSGSRLRLELPIEQEQNPKTPGWSLIDLKKVMDKLGVPFEIGKGGWPGVIAAHKNGYLVVLQGLSAIFVKGCSQMFDGGHCIVIYKDSHSDGKRWMKGDPICEAAEWEQIAVLERYAKAFDPGVSFGYFPISSPVVPKTYTQAELDAAVNAARDGAETHGWTKGVGEEKARMRRVLSLD